MYTPEEIRNIEFTKSLGGYRTSEVDPFIDKCADTVEALMQEKAELTKKLEVLADKLVEYRNEEDSIRTALLSAQRLGDTVVREANHKAGLILEDANIKAQKIADTARSSIQAEEAELERVKKEVAAFKNQMLNLYRDHLALLKLLPDVKEEAAEAAPQADAAEEPSAQPVEPLPEAAAQPAAAPPVAAPAVAPAAEALSAVPQEPAPVFTVRIPELQEEEDIQAVPVTPREVPSAAPAVSPNPRFANLKFGADYDLTEDTEEVKGFFKRKK